MISFLVAEKTHFQIRQNHSIFHWEAYTIGCSPPAKGRQNRSIATLMLTRVGILGNNAGTEKGRM